MKLEKTHLKLIESTHHGELRGFVSRHSKTGRLLGVRERSHFGKKVCVLSDHLKGKVKPNTLYEVSVKPMRSGAGYVIVAAEPILFSAQLDVIVVPKTIYRIVVRFGMKAIFFDPLCGRTPSSNSLEGVLYVLEQREDLANKEEILRTFVEEAGKLLDQMSRDGVQGRDSKEY